MAEEFKNDQGVPVSPPSPGTQPQQQHPTGQSIPPQQPMYSQSTQPVYAPAPLTHLTGGMKFGWFVVGALVGIGGIVLAWLTNVDKIPSVKSEALKFSIIGFVVWIVLGIIMSMLIGGLITAALAGAMGSAGYYDYGGYY